MRWFAGISKRRDLRTTAVKCPEIIKRRNHLIAEVMVTVNEYEERFRPPTPSLYQTFVEIRGPNHSRRRIRYLWAVAALVGGVIAGRFQTISDFFAEGHLGMALNSRNYTAAATPAR